MKRRSSRLVRFDWKRDERQQVHYEERTHVVAPRITTEGVKVPLGLWEGSTENAAVARSLLSDLVDRGLDTEQGILFAIAGAKAPAKAIRQVFGQAAPI